MKSLIEKLESAAGSNAIVSITANKTTFIFNTELKNPRGANPERLVVKKTGKSTKFSGFTFDGKSFEFRVALEFDDALSKIEELFDDPVLRCRTVREFCSYVHFDGYELDEIRAQVTTE